jgi:Tfp pilus assembly protein PilN
MSKDINLLPDITLQEEKQDRLKKLLTLTTMSILVVGMVGVIIVFAVEITLRNQFNSLIEANEQLTSDILRYKELELDQRDLKSKLGAALKIREDSNNYEFILRSLEELTPNGTTYNNLNITNDNLLSVTGLVDSSTNFNQFVTNMLANQDKPEGVFSDITLSSLSRTQDGAYQFTLTAMIKKDK